MPALVLTHQQPTPVSSASARRRSSVLLEKHLSVHRRRSSLVTPPAAFNVAPTGDSKPAFLQISEIADQIAGHLDPKTLCSTAQVSRQWHAISLRHLWRRTHLDRLNPSKEASLLAGFATLAGHIRHLTLSGYDNPIEHPFSLVKQPESLHFHSLRIQRCSKLDVAALYHILDHSVNHLGQLHLLDISSLTGNPFWASSPSTFKNLEQLVLVMDEEAIAGDEDEDDNNNNSTEEDDTEPTNEVLSGTSEVAVTTVTDAHDESGAASKNNVAICNFTDYLVDFLDKAPTIKSLTAQGVKAQTCGAGIPSVPSRLHLSLTHLDLHDSIVSGNTLGRLLVKCPNLVSLNISHLKDTYVLSGLVLPMDATAIHLKTLSLQGCFFIDGDGHGFKELFRFACHVEKLDLSRSNIDDEALAVLGHNTKSRLQDLCLLGCLQITDEGIRELLARGQLGETLQHLVVAECTELTGRSIHHVLRSCSRLVSLDISQPDILPLSMFHLEQEDDDEEEHEGQGGNQGVTQEPQQQVEGQQQEASQTPSTGSDEPSMPEPEHIPWACKDTLEWLRIKKLDVLEARQLKMLNHHLRDLAHLRALHIGGGKLKLAVLDGLGQHSVCLQQLFIDDLAHEVTMEDLSYLMEENTPHLVRLWCRHLVRYSEPWTKLREERAGLKMW